MGKTPAKGAANAAGEETPAETANAAVGKFPDEGAAKAAGGEAPAEANAAAGKVPAERAAKAAREEAPAETANAAVRKVRAAGAAKAAGEEAPAETPNAVKAPAKKPAKLCGLGLLASTAIATDSVKHRTNYKKGRAKASMDEAVKEWCTSRSSLRIIAEKNEVDSTSL